MLGTLELQFSHLFTQLKQTTREKFFTLIMYSYIISLGSFLLSCLIIYTAEEYFYFDENYFSAVDWSTFFENRFLIAACNDLTSGLCNISIGVLTIYLYNKNLPDEDTLDERNFKKSNSHELFLMLFLLYIIFYLFSYHYLYVIYGYSFNFTNVLSDLTFMDSFAGYWSGYARSVLTYFMQLFPLLIGLYFVKKYFYHKTSITFLFEKTTWTTIIIVLIGTSFYVFCRDIFQTLIISPIQLYFNTSMLSFLITFTLQAIVYSFYILFLYAAYLSMNFDIQDKHISEHESL